MIWCVLFLFVGHADVGLPDLTNPLPVLLFVVMAGTVIAGNLFPHKISFLPGMRYYAGNWDTTLWCITPSAEAKIDAGIVAIANMPAAQLEKFYGSKEAAQIPIYMGTRSAASTPTARRCSPSPTGRWPTATMASTKAAYSVTDGERICSMAIGWNFGDGHMHNEQLIAALQRRCHFEPGRSGGAARRPAVAPPDSALPTGRPGHG